MKTHMMRYGRPCELQGVVRATELLTTKVEFEMLILDPGSVSWAFHRQTIMRPDIHRLLLQIPIIS